MDQQSIVLYRDWNELAHVRVALKGESLRKERLHLRFESMGYRSKVSAKARLAAGFAQGAVISIAAAGLIQAIYCVLHYASSDHGAGDGWYLAPDLGAISAFVIFAVTATGALVWKQMSDVYARWHILSARFNAIPSHEKPGVRQYLFACVARDILELHMWAHETFRDVFKDALAMAVMIDCDYRQDGINLRLHSIAERGIEYDEATRLIGLLVELNRPPEYSPEEFFRRNHPIAPAASPPQPQKGAGPSMDADPPSSKPAA